MRPLIGFLLGWMLAAAPPLQVVGVVRSGMPPYDEAERLYRLEGQGARTLHLNEYLTLRRAGEQRPLGRLQVTALKDEYALAKLTTPGETYPLKGDLIVRHEMAAGLPVFPGMTLLTRLRPPGEFALRTLHIKIPKSPSTEKFHQETIYFLKGNAELSPAAQIKLKVWVESWGLEGRWILRVPEDPQIPESLSQARVEALKKALSLLGVSGIERGPLAPKGRSRFDSVHVAKEPW